MLPVPQIVAYIVQYTGLIPQLLAAGKDIVAFWKEHSDKVDEMIEQNRKPTPDEWAVINAKVDELRAELHS